MVAGRQKAKESDGQSE
ncbi:hypothetical protein A2U01_0115999, partial [Trifolium medium]|nr:hypothetical protein [Trifolium medium]